jgi:GH24 family phage-related lysozyme (muramidase)
MTTVDDLLTFEEGKRAFVYDDGDGKRIVPGKVMIGHPTTGIGFALDTYPLDDEEIEFLLQHRRQKAEGWAAADLGAEAWAKLDVVRRAALTSMAYQMGQTSLAGFPKMLAAVRVGDWQRAHDEALNSTWARWQTPARALREANMLLTGQWPAALTQGS